jgi:hypothetical protein
MAEIEDDTQLVFSVDDDQDEVIDEAVCGRTRI